MTHQQRIDKAREYFARQSAAVATEAERDQLREQLDALHSRLETLGGIDAAEAIAAWRADAIAKIETLPSITRATVKNCSAYKN